MIDWVVVYQVIDGRVVVHRVIDWLVVHRVTPTSVHNAQKNPHRNTPVEPCRAVLEFVLSLYPYGTLGLKEWRCQTPVLQATHERCRSCALFAGGE